VLLEKTTILERKYSENIKKFAQSTEEIDGHLARINFLEGANEKHRKLVSETKVEINQVNEANYE
ncbi:hypothetical protein PFISCL1PPCAC_17801, partial [Pristionchus fissidentatus]